MSMDYFRRLSKPYAGYAIGRQNGWLSANDIRELEDMNRLKTAIYILLMAIWCLRQADKHKTEKANEEERKAMVKEKNDAPTLPS